MIFNSLLYHWLVLLRTCISSSCSRIDLMIMMSTMWNTKWKRLSLVWRQTIFNLHLALAQVLISVSALGPYLRRLSDCCFSSRPCSILRGFQSSRRLNHQVRFVQQYNTSWLFTLIYGMLRGQKRNLHASESVLPSHISPKAGTVTSRKVIPDMLNSCSVSFHCDAHRCDS